MTTEKVNEALDKAHGQSKFKVGDRVAVYGIAFDGMRCKSFYGTVTEVLDDGWLVVNPDCPETNANDVHEKQCRRLVKRERRRVWIKCGRHGGLSSLGGQLKNPVVFGSSTKSHDPEYVEFVEVRKRGGK